MNNINKYNHFIPLSGQIVRSEIYYTCQRTSTVKPVLSSHSKQDKTKVLMAEVAYRRSKVLQILQYFRPALSDYRS